MLRLDKQNVDKDNLLLERIVSGDVRAFNLMYYETNKNIYNAVMAYVKNEHVAIELVQQVYIKIWNNRSQLGGVRSLKDYLFIVAKNLILDHFKKITTETNFFARLILRSNAAEDSVSERIEQIEYENLLRDAVEQLPPQQKETWLLVNDQELSYAETAIKMNISILTVKRHLELSRKRVREYLKQHIILLYPLFIGLYYFFSI